jgi:hypothetical protein
MTSKEYPFEVSYETIVSSPDKFIDAIFDSLQSSFLALPQGPGFVEYADFAQAYETLKQHTSSFARIEPSLVMKAIKQDALSLVVLRTILGFSPPELAYLATEETDVQISQSFARAIDRKVRGNRHALDPGTPLQRKRVEAMVTSACRLICAGAGNPPDGMIHRLDKADTKSGQAGIRHVAGEGIPYTMLLYERFLGRPFASHRDSVSGIIGQVMEDTVEAQLRRHRITFRRTKHAESIEGFDQIPDFAIPDEWNPRIVIEAKSAEDDGTARDKVTRIQHLAQISADRRAQGQYPFQVIACIDGRGFGVRREDMRKLLEATKGKVFTLESMEHLVDHTDLAQYVGVAPDRG